MLLVELAQRIGDRFERALHVGLQHEVERGDLAPLDHREDVLESRATGQAHRVLEARGATPPRACLGDRARRLLVGSDAQLVTCEGHVVEAEHLDRHRRTRFLHRATVLVEQRADATPRTTRDDRVADPQGAAFDDRGDNWTTALVEIRLEHERASRRLRVGGELFDLGDEEDRLEQVVDADLRGRRDVDDDRVAAPCFGNQLAFDELLAHARRVGVFAVDLRDRDDDRNVCRARVVERFDRLRHHAVVGRDDEHRDVGGARATGTHRGERLVARGVDEGDGVAVVHCLVRADVLRDTAGLARNDVGVADRVEQRRLAVVEQRLQFELRFLTGLDEQDLGAQRLGDQLDHLVGERLRPRDHLARVEQQAHEVGGVAIQLRRELLDRDASLDDDLAFGHRRVGGCERRHRLRADVLEVFTAPLPAARTLALRPGSPTTAGSPGAARTAAHAGTTAAAAGPARATACEASSTTARARREATATATSAAWTARRATRPRPGGLRRRAGTRRRRDAAPAARWRRDRTTGDAARRRGRRGRFGHRSSTGRRRAGVGRGRTLRGRRRRPGLQRRVGDDARGPHHPVAGGGDLLWHRLDRRDRRGLDGLDRRGLGHGCGRLALGRLLRGGWLGGAGGRLRGRFDRLGDRLGGGLLDGGFPAQTLGVREPPDAIRERVVDARRMALHADLQAFAQLEDDLVLDPELSCQLVDPDLLGGQSRSRLCFPVLVFVCQATVVAGNSLSSVARTRARSSLVTGVRNATANVRRRSARSRQSTARSRHSHAPRPGPAPSARPATSRRTLTSSAVGAVRRHPMHVRRGMLLLTGLRFGGRVARDGGLGGELRLRGS